MASFKVPCPSCEAPVLIKDPKLIGTKVECPKCKYRFKAEEPAPSAAHGAKADGTAKADDEDKKAQKTKAPGKNKKLIKIGIGVGAVVLLVVVGVVAFGGSGPKKTPPGNVKGNTNPPVNPGPEQ